MNSIEKALTAALIALTLVVLVFFFGQTPRSGNTIDLGTVPNFSSASSIAVGPQQVITLVSRTNNCASRVVSTASTSLMLSFGDITPSATQGTWQGASTTVAYENGTYGCGTITAWASASSTITLTVFNQ